jgi:hypothetical protein
MAPGAPGAAMLQAALGSGATPVLPAILPGAALAAATAPATEPATKA